MKKCLIAIALVGAPYCSEQLIAMEKDEKRISKEMEEVIVTLPQGKSAQEILALKNPLAFKGATKHLVKTQMRTLQNKKGTKLSSKKEIENLKSALAQVNTIDDVLVNKLNELNDETQKSWSHDRIVDALWGLGYFCAAGGTGAGAGYFTLCTSAPTASRITGSVSMYTACLGFVYKALEQCKKVYANDYTHDKINTTLQKITSIEEAKKELEEHIKKLALTTKNNEPSEEGIEEEN